MKYEIIWHEIAERKHVVEADSFEEAVAKLGDDWNGGEFEDDTATLFNEYICDATGEKTIEFNGYW